MKQDTNNENNSITPITLGEKFKEARNALNLSINDISNQLHIFKNIIEEIESGNYTKEDMTIFMRGYIKNYARFLKIPQNEIDQVFTDLGVNIKEYKKIAPETDVTKSSLMGKPVKTATYVIIVTLIVLVSSWYYMHSDRDSMTQTEDLQKLNNKKPSTLTIKDNNQIIETEEFDY